MKVVAVLRFIAAGILVSFVGCGEGEGDGADLPRRVWGTAERIETNYTDSVQSLEIATNADGNAVAIWRRRSRDQGSILANQYVVGVGWGTAELLIKTDDTQLGWYPMVAVDSTGNAVAVWYQSAGTRSSIWANRYVAGTGWGTAELIETDDANDAGIPRVAVDSAGNAIAVWAQLDGTRVDIRANRYVVGAGWGTAELIEIDNAGDADYPDVAIDPTGHAVAVWRQSDGTRWSIWANRYVVGAGWGTAELVETENAGDAGYPDVAIDSTGSAIVVWRQHDGTTNNILANRNAIGTGWGTAELIEIDNTAYAGVPQVAMDPAGNAIAVWNQPDGTRDNIWGNRYELGTGWGNAKLIKTDVVGDVHSAQVAMDAFGNAIAVWYQSEGTHRSIWANRYEVGAGWGSGAPIETDLASDAFSPKVALDAAGNAVAVWYQFAAPRWQIWASRFD